MAERKRDAPIRKKLNSMKTKVKAANGGKDPDYDTARQYLNTKPMKGDFDSVVNRINNLNK